MNTQNVLTVLEILGTVAFAISGALIAIKSRFDIFGVTVIGTLTAVGGGIMRDVLIGKIPPAIFSKVYIIIIAIATSIVVFFVAYLYRKKFDRVKEKIEQINNVFDAIGLAAFTVMGMEVAFESTFTSNVFLCVILGVLTGVGGGVLRDILTENPPYIFKKHIYASASLLGAVIYYLLTIVTENVILPTAVAIIFIVTIRMLATVFRWKLPKVQIEESNVQK